MPTLGKHGELSDLIAIRISVDVRDLVSGVHRIWSIPSVLGLQALETVNDSRVLQTNGFRGLKIYILFGSEDLRQNIMESQSVLELVHCTPYLVEE